MKIERKCKNCEFFDPDEDGYFREKGYEGKGYCLEGGFTEIGDPDKVMSGEDCNVWFRASWIRDGDLND